MIRAIDNDGNDILIWEANRGEAYFCPICHQVLVQRRGDIREHHFAHAPLRYGGSRECIDKWNYDKTDWHIDWQKRFPTENCEKIVCYNGQKHIADVQINDIVIEFQHSPISIEEFRQRNSFYTGAGFSVVWIFDLIDEWNDDKISVDDRIDNKYSWSYPKKVFRDMEIKDEDAVIYFQFSDDTDEDIGVLERVTGGYKRFTQFYTDLNHALSIPEFVNKAKANSALLIPTKTHINKAPDFLPDGRSVYDIWKPTYAHMVVRNLYTNKNMIIFGKHGVMDQQDNGNIIGKYSQYNNGHYEYSSKKYVVWDADKNIWELVSVKKAVDSHTRTFGMSSELYTGKTLFALIDSRPTDILFFCKATKKVYLIDFVDRNRKTWNAFYFDTATGEVGATHQNVEVLQYAKLPCWSVHLIDNL